MSRKNHITNAKAQKLRSGHTYWRCQVQRDGTVYISEEFLKGSRLTVAMRSTFPEDVPERKRKVLYTSVKIGPKAKNLWTRGKYLSDVNHGSSINTFTTRRAAQRWATEVEAGWHPEAVAEAQEHWDFCDSLSRMFDDYNDYYDDGPYNGLSDDEPESVKHEYSEPMTLEA